MQNFPPYAGSVSEELLKATQLRYAINNAMHSLNCEQLVQVLEMIKRQPLPFTIFPPITSETAGIPIP